MTMLPFCRLLTLIVIVALFSARFTACDLITWQAPAQMWPTA